MALQNERLEEGGKVLDRAHLDRNTMQNQELAAEVLGLFLGQLPAMLDALDAASTPAEWSFATHALKGSSAAIGAQRLQHLAAALEAMPFPGDVNIRLLRIQAVRAAAAEFRMVVFPAPIS